MRIKGQLRVFEAFAGYGSQSIALSRARIPYRIVGYSEVDPYAIRAYQTFHPNVKNFGDIKTIKPKEIPDFDLLTYSSPCTSITPLGKREGMKKGSGTESSLVWETEKIIKEKRPKYLLMENVGSITNKVNLEDLQAWQKVLTKLGYTNFIQILDAQNFDLPQHRERAIMVSILDCKENFEIPTHSPRHRSRTMLDMVEKNPDPKYNLKSHYLDTYFVDKKAYKGPKYLNKVGCISGKNGTYGRVNAGFIYDVRGLMPAVMRAYGCGGNNYPHLLMPDGTIRHETPRESLRLQGLYDREIDMLFKAELSDTRLYMLAGNSIPVPILTAVFKALFK